MTGSIGGHLLDFDDVDDWVPRLAVELGHLVSVEAKQLVRARNPEYVEDARDLLLGSTDRTAVIAATLSWIRENRIAGYHGTRLTDEDANSVQTNGLVPLRAVDRRKRLVRALSPHPTWRDLESRLDAAIDAHGPGKAVGSREGQVHLTLSRASLLDPLDYYITHGSEFDYHVSNHLLGQEGLDLLARDGNASVVKVAMPGSIAINAAHVYSSVERRLADGEVPLLVDEFLKVWSFRHVRPQFQTIRLGTDCCMMFRSAIPSTWIACIEIVHAPSGK